MKNRLPFSSALLVLFCVAACAPDGPAVEPGAATIIDDAALADESNADDWLAYGRTTSERRFSPLTQIDDTNVGGLAPDWYMDLPDARGLVSTPLVVDGVIYFIESMNRVRAVDATTGSEIWTYDPRVAERATEGLRVGWEHNRGIAYYKGRIFSATWDGWLNAIDAETGDEVWRTLTIDPTKALYITGAPKVFKDRVLIGNGGTEVGGPRGYVTAYDTETGEQAWRFYIVPGNPADGFENDAMRMAAETWTGEWWRYGGGGNAWHGFTYDHELDQVLIGTGNGSPWNRVIRSPDGGDNLFLDSVVALDAETGEYRWHYQNTPGETWDFNSNMDIILADLMIDGVERKVYMQAPKNGFFYVVDRTNGELISAEPYAETNWATHVDMETGRPVEVPGARFLDAPARITPSPAGAHSWHAMSYNPETGLVYIPTIHYAWTFAQPQVDLATWESPDWRTDTGTMNLPDPLLPGGEHGSLQAWNPVAGERVWEVSLEGSWQPGTLTTAGNLVFHGRDTGELFAYRADTGEPLWSHNLGLGISAPPITYAVDGKQYVALLVGWGGGGPGLGIVGEAAGWAYGVHPRRLVVFSLDGATELPEMPPASIPVPIEAPDFTVNPAIAAAGLANYETTCNVCHGFGVIAGGMAPDLRASAIVLDDEAFASVVRDGARMGRGMPTYAKLSDNELLGIRHYIRQQADLLETATSGNE